MQKISLSTIAALFISSQLIAQTTELQTITIATKSEKNIDGVAATVEVITQEDIQKMGAQSFKDIVQNTPGLNLIYATYPTASSLSRASISIRGMSPNGTLILLDGRRLAGEVQNPYDLDRIPASFIERVEILKGPMSSLYGADALGGVINIITKRPTNELKIEAGASYGANEHGDGDNLNLNISIQDRADKLAYSAYASYIDTNSYAQNEQAEVWLPTGKRPSQTPSAPLPNMSSIADSYDQAVTYREDSQIYSIGSRISYDITKDLTVGFDLNYFKEDRSGTYIGYFHPTNFLFLGGPNAGKQIPAFNVPVDSKDENSRLDLSLDATLKASSDLTLKARVYSSDYKKRNDTSAIYWSEMNYASKAASSQNGLNADVLLQVAELSAIYALAENHLISAGAEYRDETRESSAFANNNTMTTKDISYSSIYAQDEWQVTDKLSSILGIRYDDISEVDSKTTFRVGGVYAFGPLANLRANFAQGFRSPNIAELYIFKQTPTGLQVGSDLVGYDLKPESLNAYEIGLSGHSEKLKYDAVVFYNDIKDMITQVSTTYSGTAAFTYQNIADATTKGAELSLGYDFTNDFSANLSYALLKTKNNQTGKELEYQPENTVMANLNYKLLPSLNMAIYAKYIGEQNYTQTLSRGAPTQTTQDAKTNAYTLVDLKADYALSKMLNIYGGVNNVADEKVDAVLGSTVGRYYYAGVRAKF